MTHSESNLMEEIVSLESRQIQWTQELISIPTVNPYSGDSSAASEASGQDWIEEKLREMGAQVDRIPVPSDIYARGGVIGPRSRSWLHRENVVGKWKLGNGRGPRIIVNDHMDTVGVVGMEIPPYDPVIEDGKLHGRGSTDTKGNLVMGLIAIAGLLNKSDGLNGEIIFQSVVDEECNGAGAGTLACCVAGIDADFAIVLDGAGGDIINGCNGLATAKLLIHGRAGHCALNNTVNAIDKACTVKSMIDSFAQGVLSRAPTCFTNIGVFHSGSIPGVVPSVAEMQINFSYPLEDAGKAKEQNDSGVIFRSEFALAIQNLSLSDPWFKEKPVEIEWIKEVYPFLCPLESNLVNTAVQAFGEVSGRSPRVAPMAGWFDGAHLANQLGIPTIGIGHGLPGMAHTSTEYAEMSSLLLGAKKTGLLLSRILHS